MKEKDKGQKVRDRYITFKNIDCYKNARDVLDAMYELFTLYPESKNRLWQRFEKELPEDYHKQLAREESKDILYLVCSNVFYIYELFDEYEFEKGVELLEKAELECC